jgi:hypothetical protein
MRAETFAGRRGCSGLSTVIKVINNDAVPAEVTIFRPWEARTQCMFRMAPFRRRTVQAGLEQARKSGTVAIGRYSLQLANRLS